MPYTPWLVFKFPTKKNSCAHFKIQNEVTAIDQKLKRISFWFLRNFRS